MAKDGTVKIGTELDKSGLNKGLSGLGGFAKKGFSVIGSAAASAAKVATGAIAAVGTAIVGLGAAGVKYNASIEQYQTSFEVMTGSADKAAEVIANLKKVGAETPFELNDLADTTQLLMNYGFTADDALDKMMMLGDISQGSADKMNRIATAYGQMSSAGKVSLEDIKQMIEAGFNPLQEISESTGESMESLYDRISNGTISVDEITASMQRATSEGGKYYQSMEKQSKTINGMISTLKDNAQQLLGEVVQPITESIGRELLPAAIGAIEDLTTAFQTNGIERLIEAGSQIVSNILLGIADALPGITITAVQIIQSIADNLTANLPQITSAGGEMLNALVTGITSVIGSLIPLAVSVISEFLNGINTNLPQIVQSGGQILGQLANGIIALLPSLAQTAINIVLTLVQYIVSNIPQIIATGAEMIVQLAAGIVSMLPEIAAAALEIANNILFQITGIDWLGLGSNVITWIGDGINSLFGTIPDLVKDIATKAYDFFKNTDWAGIGKNLVNKIKDGIQSLFSGIPDKVKSIAKDASEKFKSTDWKSLGSNLIKKIVNGISGLVRSIPDKLKTIAGDAKKAFTDTDWLSVGENIINGIKNGVKNMASSLVDSAVSAASDAVNTVKGWLGIHSPSKRARDEIGVNMIAGVNEGIENETPHLEETSVKSVQTAVHAMKRSAASDFVLDMQAGSYQAAENNEMSARSKFQNKGYAPEDQDDGGDIVIVNEVNVDGEPLYKKAVRRTKESIAREQKSNRAMKGDVIAFG